MQVEKPIEIKTDWNDALKGLGYTCGGLSVGLAGLIEGVSLVKNGEHAVVGQFEFSKQIISSIFHLLLVTPAAMAGVIPSDLLRFKVLCGRQKL